MIRQCQDLSELRAVRQLITQEMDLKFKDANCTGELASLKYTQKLIDIRIGNLQNHRNFSNNLSNKYIDKEKIQIAVLLSLDEILSKELALSYYLDYLSILNLQKYVIFYLMAQEWRTTLSKTKTIDTQDEAQKQIRDKAFSIFKVFNRFFRSLEILNNFLFSTGIFGTYIAQLLEYRYRTDRSIAYQNQRYLQYSRNQLV